MPPKKKTAVVKASRKQAPASKEVSVESVVATLKSKATKATREGMARYGIPSDNALGVTVGTPMISARRTCFTANGERVRYLYARYHPENYRFLVDLQPGGGRPMFESVISPTDTRD